MPPPLPRAGCQTDARRRGHLAELEAAQRSGDDERLRLVMQKLNASVRETFVADTESKARVE